MNLDFGDSNRNISVQESPEEMMITDGRTYMGRSIWGCIWTVTMAWKDDHPKKKKTRIICRLSILPYLLGIRLLISNTCDTQ